MLRRGQLLTNPIHEVNHGTTAIERIVSGALFDFIGMLTTLEEPIVLSERHNPTRLVDMLVDWAYNKRGLNTFDADVYGWQDKIHVAHELVRVARILSGEEEDVKAEKKRAEKKVRAVKTLAENITRLRHNVTRDLQSDDERTRMTALAIALMDKTAERVGNDESAQNGHVGVTGFKKKHISTDGNRVLLKYIGKSGVEHEKSFSDKRISDIIRGRLERCTPNDFLLSCSDGYKVRADRVNRYLEDFGITAKDIRGYSANRLMIEALQRQSGSQEEDERKKVFLSVLKRVAEAVGHGPQMLRNSYLIPSLETSWVKQGKIIKLTEE